MKRERGWFQIGAGLVLFLSVVVLPGWGACTTDARGNCVRGWFCSCP